MAERAALPCVLTGDANDELERHDCYELATELGGIGENLLSGPSPWVGGSDGLPPSCRSHGPCSDPRPTASADPGSHR